MPDQKAIRLLVKEVIQITGVPKCLLSDRGTNLLSHLMTDVCRHLGMKKLNTTSYHPACDGLVEMFNCTLKTALRKTAAECGDHAVGQVPVRSGLGLQKCAPQID